MSHRPQDLINDWRASIDLNEKAHSMRSQMLVQYHRAVGVSAVVLAVVAGATLFMGMENVYLRWFAGLLGFLAAVLAGVQTFYSHAQRAETHRATASQLAQLRREVEELEKLPPNYLKAQTEVMVQIGQHLDRIKQSAPPLQKEIFRQARAGNENSDQLLKKIKERNDPSQINLIGS